MRKVVYYSKDLNNIRIFDSKDYIIISEYDQRIDDKYVDSGGDIIDQHYALSKGDVIVRNLYKISFTGKKYELSTKRKKNYQYFKTNHLKIEKIRRSLITKTSVIDFFKRKQWVEAIFSEGVEVEELYL